MQTRIKMIKKKNKDRKSVEFCTEKTLLEENDALTLQLTRFQEQLSEKMKNTRI